MRRLAKGSSAQCYDGSGNTGSRLFGRAFATRGAFSDSNGSGASAATRPRRLGLFGSCAALVAAGALFVGAPVASADPCPNEALREENNSLTLPECRAYELVSHDDTGGLGIVAIDGVSDQGGQILFRAQTIGVPKSLAGQWTPYVYDREESGWKLRQMGIDPEYFSGESLGGYWYGSDFSVLWSKAKQSQYKRGEVQFTITRPDGTSSFASPLIKPLEYVGINPPNTYQLRGQSPDLSTYVFEFQHSSSNAVKFIPDEPLVAAANNVSLYLVTDANTASPTVTLLNRDPAGAPMVSACGTTLGAESTNGVRTHAISTDGSIVYFSTRPTSTVAASCGTPQKTANPMRVFKRIDASSTVEVSKSQCTRISPTPCSPTNGDDVYQGASADGSKVFFSSVRQLANSDEDATADLYVYDTSPPFGEPQLAQVTVGDITAGHPVPGKGAEVLGVLDNAADGSRVYFVAKGQLTSAATAGANNLYVFERDAAHPTGRLAFVAKLAAGDSSLWTSGSRANWALPYYGPGGVGDGDGHILLFRSAAQLLVQDTDSVNDIYRYDDATAALLCVTCQGNGAFPVKTGGRGGRSASSDSGHYIQSSRTASEDVSAVIFETAEPLSAADQNTVDDVYQWREGVISLITAGAGEAGAVGPASASEHTFISPDGEHIYFMTTAQVLPSDLNTAPDVYDAYVGGGLPQPKDIVRCAEYQTCHPAAAEPPGATPSATSIFSGPGNQPEAPMKKCAKGKVRKHGVCVKRRSKPRKHPHRSRSAGNGRGAK